MRNGEQGPQLYNPKNDQQRERGPDLFPANRPGGEKGLNAYSSYDRSALRNRNLVSYDTTNEDFENKQRERYRHEKEQQIKKRGKAKKAIVTALVAAGLVTMAGVLVNVANKNDRESFAYNQKENIAQSSILQENNIGFDDIEFGKDNMQFDIDDVHYKLMVDAKDIDGKGLMNADGGVYEGIATYHENGKKITKTFDVENDNQDNSLKDGVSIDEAMAGLGCVSKNSENVIE